MQEITLYRACLVFFAGAVKVLWKIIVALRKKNIWWMFLQMRILMPIGMLMMIVSLIIDRSKIKGASLWQAVTSMPSLICFIIGIIGMVLMTVFAFTLDSSNPKSNWIEQLTNAAAQAAFLAGILFLM